MYKVCETVIYCTHVGFMLKEVSPMGVIVDENNDLTI